MSVFSDTKPTPRTRVLFVDNNSLESHVYRIALDDAGFDVIFTTSVEEALSAVHNKNFAAVVLDVMMDPGERLGTIETKAGFETGVALAREIRKIAPGLKLVALTASDSPDVREFFTRDRSVSYFHRSTLPVQFAESLSALLVGHKRRPKIFIVHGRDRETLLDLKNFLQNGLKLDEPVVLFERPSRTRNILQKFEDYARDIDIAFVIASPDDVGSLSGVSPDDQARRVRQNVIFEFGYFLGYLKRDNGQVILLHKGPIELPSDVQGLLYIDVSHGVESAAEEIRRELAEWL